MTALVVLGAGGQVGSDVVRRAARQWSSLAAFDRASCDVTDATALDRAVPERAIVINCAAFTAVDKAETEQEQAFRINAEGPQTLAAICEKRGATLLHISTDYVFDGTGERPWCESDPIAPLGAYGCSKAAGEAAIRTTLDRHIILRTSWVFGATGANFVKTMRRLAETRSDISVVDDQIGGPTPADAIAAALLTIAATVRDGKGVFGTYHFAGAPFVSWYEFARAILADRSDVAVKPIPTSAYPTPARRPHNSRLDCTRIEEAYGIAPPDWHGALRSL